MRAWFPSKERRSFLAASPGFGQGVQAPMTAVALFFARSGSAGGTLGLSLFSLRTFIIACFCMGSKSGFQKLAFLSPVAAAPGQREALLINMVP